MRTRIGVAGGGLMGCGIAAKIAAAGFDVLVYDSAPEAVRRIHDTCAATFTELKSGGVMTSDKSGAAAARIRVATHLGELATMEMVIEAIFESLPAKREFYRSLEEVVSPATIIASSTSGFTPTALFEGVRQSGRFLVAHFWNPPHLIPLVEVLGSEATVPANIAATMLLLSQCGCHPVQLHKAVPGFIGNRIQFAVLREALHLLREGVADAETIDTVVRETLGRRYRWSGPLEGADAGGLETFLNIATHLLPELAKGEDMLDTLREHTDRGEKGRASGRGFYVWDAARTQNLREARVKMLHVLRSYDGLPAD
jgi:3-hydroxybutyryl-CoA dehydrogenase